MSEAAQETARWATWTATPIAGDASARQFARLNGPRDETVIRMITPATETESQAAFVQIARYLGARGFKVPDILDEDGNTVILEDLGTTDVATALIAEPELAPRLYGIATDALIKLHEQTPPSLSRMTPEIAGDMVRLCATHYAKDAELEDVVAAAITDVMQRHVGPAEHLALRDFHAENLIWRPEKSGDQQLGLLDFQDAFIAPAGYDLVSLLRDARRDVDDTIHEACIAQFCNALRLPQAQFELQLACLGVQRNLRILGVFARLAHDLGKRRYLAMMPRVWGHILADLSHPALADLDALVRRRIPPPDGWAA